MSFLDFVPWENADKDRKLSSFFLRFPFVQNQDLETGKMSHKKKFLRPFPLHIKLSFLKKKCTIAYKDSLKDINGPNVSSLKNSKLCLLLN